MLIMTHPMYPAPLAAASELLSLYVHDQERERGSILVVIIIKYGLSVNRSMGNFGPPNPIYLTTYWVWLMMQAERQRERDQERARTGTGMCTAEGGDSSGPAKWLQSAATGPPPECCVILDILDTDNTEVELYLYVFRLSH